MAQILAIYGLVSSVIIQGDLEEKMPLYQGFLQLGAGIAVGLCGLAAGFAIGIVGDAGVRASTQQPRLYIGMVLILIFAEVLGLYGVVVTTEKHDKARVEKHGRGRGDDTGTSEDGDLDSIYLLDIK
ncbi:hypothetical protein NPX13_g2199 [Xylaria arbuscula]|uniref:V-type proton ATPase proteolipid subunit n=1 Tax=Xylaria arbuscula TaxID=114810 RepID=A0A9W8TQK8_9PEZI|nr:hypothetical protein NPX13_g2199 [Xylaria arbuscula]